ncbi:MAG: hypothetical protein Q9191_001220 [Dirinaria sp. TL-2023a]
MPRSTAARAFMLLQLYTSAWSFSIPTHPDSTLFQPGTLSSLDEEGLTTNYTTLPHFGPGAHWYYIANEQAPIISLATSTTTNKTSNEDSYAYRFGIQNMTQHPPLLFEKFDLARNLFHDEFQLITEVPGSGQGPKTPYPGGRFSGSKHPNELPGRIEMYLDANPVGFGMWYRDIAFMLKCLFDAEIGNPEKGRLGYYQFQFEVRLNLGPEWYKGVHGYFLPA